MIEVAVMSSIHSRRDWLNETLRAESSVHVAGTATTFPFLRSLLNEAIVDVSLIDLTSMPEAEIAHDWLLELLDTVPILFLLSVPDPWIFSNVLRAEKGGLLRSDASPQQIIRAIQSTLAGLLSLDSSLVPQSEGIEDLAEELTPRETAVLRLLAEGLGNREIANRLSISEHTIKFHIRSILSKLQASTRTEAVTRGLRAGLIEL
jgi:two-component system, NarL family, response regulator YdfI